MAQLQDMSDVINRLSGGSSGTPLTVFFHKGTRTLGGTTLQTTTVLGRMSSAWTWNGSPSSGAVPTTVTACGQSTPGAIILPNPGGGRQRWLVNSCCMTEAITHGVTFFDRLLHIGGLSGTNTSPQTVGGTITRYTGAESAGNQIFVEIYTTLGSTSTTFTASYTNQDGTSGRTTEPAVIGGTNFREVHRMINATLQTGDTGVRSVQSVTLAGSTDTVGDFGVTIVRRIVVLPMVQAGLSMRDFLAGLPTMPEIKPDSCIFAAVLPPISSGAAPEINAELQFLEA